MPSERVIVCMSCKIAVPFLRLGYHLLEVHRVKQPTRNTIVARFDGLPAAQTHESLTPRSGGLAPLEYLHPPVPGFRCLHCPDWNTRSSCVLRRHAKIEHGIDANKCRGEEKESSCFLQRWTNRTDVVSGKYWTVNMHHQSKQSELEDYSGPQSSNQQLLREEDVLLQVEAEEERRLLNEQRDGIALDEELDHDENTDWLRGCEWPTWFASKPLHLIVAASSLPSADTSMEFPLGLWNGLDCVSSAGSERIIWKIVEASRIMFRRCEQTLKHTPRVLRCWLRSWTPSFLAFPFELPRREQTRRRYYGYHERFLCYIFRIWALSRNMRETMKEITGLQLTTAQTAMMSYIWDSTATLVKDTDGGKVPQNTPDPIYENLFQLLVMFWTDISKDGKMHRNAIVHFSGVLGIHRTELAFRKPYDYTPFLSALIWVGRLIILEYALPLAPYVHLHVPWPDRTTYQDQAQRLREHIRPKYLQRGCLAPVGYFIERLQHGRAIARHEGPRTNIS